ncbi:MAG: hypothetical protein Ct9H300mP13_2870 [Gammaproteobacteria bacterium]|nr:MAG: hypothetical protein Ct9H300mP13_2870 [Gammaproteobacteria bacterium]
MTLFWCAFKEPLVHQVVTAYWLVGGWNQRAEKRSQVRGGGRKPFRQKGTGRLELARFAVPCGVVVVRYFRSTRSYAQKVNRKAYRLRSARFCRNSYAKTVAAVRRYRARRAENAPIDCAP